MPRDSASAGPVRPSPPLHLRGLDRQRQQLLQRQLRAARHLCVRAHVWGLGLGFGVWGLGFGVWGLGFGVWGLGFRIWE